MLGVDARVAFFEVDLLAAQMPLDDLFEGVGPTQGLVSSLRPEDDGSALEAVVDADELVVLAGRAGQEPDVDATQQILLQLVLVAEELLLGQHPVPFLHTDKATSQPASRPSHCRSRNPSLIVRLL